MSKTRPTPARPAARAAARPAAPAASPPARPAAPQAAAPPDPDAPPRDLGKLIRVRATRTGFVDNARRRAGDVFDVHRLEFSSKWMEVVAGDTPTEITGPKAALERIHDEAIAGKLKTTHDDPLGTSTGSRA